MKRILSITLLLFSGLGAFAAERGDAFGFGLDFPIFTSLTDQAGTFVGVGSLIGTKNTAGVHVFWKLSDWALLGGLRFGIREITPFSSSQSVTTDPTLYILDATSGLSWLEFGLTRRFPFILNDLITFTPSVGFDFQQLLTGTVPSQSSSADFYPLMVVLGAAFDLDLRNDLYLSPGFRYGVDAKVFPSHPFDFSTISEAQQITFGLEIGYAYGD